LGALVLPEVKEILAVPAGSAIGFDDALHPGQPLPVADDGKADVERADAFRLVGQDHIGGGLFERMAQLTRR
jgi:hypothetical protein